MSINKKLLPTALVLGAAFTLVVLAQSVFAQVPIVKGKGKLLEVIDELKGQGLVDNQPTDIYTVEAKRTLVITDIIVANLTDSNAVFFELVGKFNQIKAPADGSFVANLGTGIEYGPGEHVILMAQNGNVSYNLRGYLRKE